MIQENINKLIPFISENFITYPLWEEGKYIPFVNFWQKAETVSKCNQLDKRLRTLDTDTGYCIGIEDKQHSSVIHRCFIYPEFIETDDGGYEFVKKDWSIEEMISMLEVFLNNGFK